MKLFRQVKSDIGEVIDYEEVPDTLYSGKVKEGVWLIRKISHGGQYTWVCNRLRDNPKAVKLMQILPFREKIMRNIDRRMPELETDILTQRSDKVCNRLFKCVIDAIGA